MRTRSPSVLSKGEAGREVHGDAQGFYHHLSDALLLRGKMGLAGKLEVLTSEDRRLNVSPGTSC